MKKVWNDTAWNDYLYWQSQDKKTLRKINSIIKEIERGGGKGLGKAELLKGNLSGICSSRIDEKNRLLWHISKDGFPEILSCRGHYDAIH
jgi:toxin YoeB